MLSLFVFCFCMRVPKRDSKKKLDSVQTEPKIFWRYRFANSSVTPAKWRQELEFVIDLNCYFCVKNFLPLENRIPWSKRRLHIFSEKSYLVNRPRILLLIKEIAY